MIRIVGKANYLVRKNYEHAVEKGKDPTAEKGHEGSPELLFVQKYLSPKLLAQKKEGRKRPFFYAVKARLPLQVQLQN